MNGFELWNFHLGILFSFRQVVGGRGLGIRAHEDLVGKWVGQKLE